VACALFTLCGKRREYHGRIDVLNFNASDCHRLSNGLTLVHEFDRLCLWFEVSGVEFTMTCLIQLCRTPHTPTEFALCMAVESFPHPRTGPTNHLLPDPRYLKLHAVVCRVGHISGVTEYLDMYDHEQDERTS